MRVPFSSPRIDQLIIDEVIDTLNSGWITTGCKTHLFEQNLTSYCENKQTLCVNSATSGLELILRWFGINDSDEVIVPVYTYCATANVVLHCGATPVLVDINECDFNISVEKIKNAITSKTKVIIPVDVGGNPCDYTEIYDLIQSEEIKKLFKPGNDIQQQLGRILILTDAAHSLGSSYRGKKTGSISDITVFSFHAVKNLTTAEGGAIAFNLPEPFDNDEIYRYLSIVANHGQNKNALTKSKLCHWKYDIIDAGYKMNMPDILASLGLIELSRYENDTLVKRKTIVEFYNNALAHYNWAIIPNCLTPVKTPSWHLYQFRIKGITEQYRDMIIQKLSIAEISVNVHFQPLPMFSFYKKLGYQICDYPNAYKAYSTEISLPIFYDLSILQMQYITDNLINTILEYI